MFKVDNYQRGSHIRIGISWDFLAVAVIEGYSVKSKWMA